jgi:hypothetical protein
MATDTLTPTQLMQACDLALAGDWDAAHQIVQADAAGDTANWIHAVLHRIEGDLGNATYWYQRARRQPGCANPQAELAAIKVQLAHRA